MKRCCCCPASGPPPWAPRLPASRPCCWAGPAGRLLQHVAAHLARARASRSATLQRAAGRPQRGRLTSSRWWRRASLTAVPSWRTSWWRTSKTQGDRGAEAEPGAWHPADHQALQPCAEPVLPHPARRGSWEVIEAAGPSTASTARPAKGGIRYSTDVSVRPKLKLWLL